MYPSPIFPSVLNVLLAAVLKEAERFATRIARAAPPANVSALGVVTLLSVRSVPEAGNAYPLRRIEELDASFVENVSDECVRVEDVEAVERDTVELPADWTLSDVAVVADVFPDAP